MFKKNLQKIKFLIIVIVVFLLGIFAEKSKIDDKILQYTPSPNLLDCLIKYNKKKNKIEDYFHKSIWTNNEIKESDYKKLHNFFGSLV